jgi:hypothetical protein
MVQLAEPHNKALELATQVMETLEVVVSTLRMYGVAVEVVLDKLVKGTPLTETTMVVLA